MTTLEEEQRELWDALLNGLSDSECDPDRVPACHRLLRHLVDTASACHVGNCADVLTAK